MKKLNLCLSLVLIGLFGSVSFAETPAADNSAINVRDASGDRLTPQDQSSGTTADVEITRRIRADLVGDNNLSIQAKNIKIITLDQSVTLRGPVKSAAEAAKIVTKAKQVAHHFKINNELEVVR